MWQQRLHLLIVPVVLLVLAPCLLCLGHVYRIPTADGDAELYTVVHETLIKPDEQCLVFTRTPYGTSTIQYWIEESEINDLGYNIAVQDFRGRVKSTGNYSMWRTAYDDATTSIQWFSQQSFGQHGVVGFGFSADGVALTLAMRHPSTLNGACVWWATGDLYGLVFQGGALRQHLMQGWLTLINETAVIDPYLLPHEQYGDWWWPAEFTAQDAAQVTYPSVHHASWYDIFLQGNLRTWQLLDQYAAVDVRKHTYLVVGAMSMHCLDGGGDYHFPHDMTTEMSKECHNVWEWKCKGGELKEFPRIQLYFMGPGLEKTYIGNQWCSWNEWPATQTQSFYLDFQSGALTTDAAAIDRSGSASYLYDPVNPVPTRGGNEYLQNCGPYDQRPVETRPDVLVFTSDPLSQPLYVLGNMTVQLTVASNCTDTDFTAKLTDVYPDGKSMIVQDSVVRMRWRNGRAGNATRMEPDTRYTISVDLWTTAYVFNSGHQLRLALSSSNYPRFDANPNTGLPLADHSSTKLTAHNTVYAAATTASGETALSRLTVQLLSANDYAQACTGAAAFGLY